MDSSATESPLDVLSRAATMVQDSTFNTLPPSYDEARSYLKCKESAANATTGGKWNKREQRRTTRHAGTGGSGITVSALSGHNAPVTTNVIHHPEPIDMSITKKLRGSPPSYTQSVKLIQLAAAGRASVITSCSGNSNNSNNSSDMSDGDGVCDPVVDEHFRRSLGKDYMSVFSSNNNKSHSTPNGSQNDTVTEDTGSALSVDDHFAKALGDTWLILQHQQREMESKKKKKEDTDSAMPIDQVQDVSTSNTKATNVKANGQKSLLRHDRRLP